MLRWVGFAVGLLVLSSTSFSVLHTVAGPRGRSSRLAAGLGMSVERVGRAIAVRLSAPASQDRILALVGPLAFVLVLIAWIVCYIGGFTLVIWPFVTDLATAGRVAGSSVCTLGFAAPDRVAPTILTFWAASTGLIVVTLELAYLPSLYAAYNRRERVVTMLASRCEGNLTGEALLLRHLRDDWQDGLVGLFADWEVWAADIRETHTNYPILISFRAGEPSASWPWALLAVLDAAVLYRALLPQDCPPQADATLRIGVNLVHAMAPAGRRTGKPPQLRDVDLIGTALELRSAGYPVGADLAETSEQLRVLRAEYAPAIAGLADQLLLPPPPDRTDRRPAQTIQSTANA